jgi:phenylacetate-coenzyme A ligase PaaK-like adenylate-forming protein
METQDGSVIWEDHFYPEIIDPVTGAVLPYDAQLGTQQGELVSRPCKIHFQARQIQSSLAA